MPDFAHFTVAFLLRSFSSLLIIYIPAFVHSPNQPVYTATKHGVIGFTRALSVRHTHLYIHPQQIDSPPSRPKA